MTDEGKSFLVTITIVRSQSRIDIDDSLDHLSNLTLGADKITTLSKKNPDGHGISGLLYVPKLDENSSCYNQSRPFIPDNVVHREDFTNHNGALYNLYMGIAPWFSAECALEYLNHAQIHTSDDFRGMVFYVPDNGTDRPPAMSSPLWSLNDREKWKSDHDFPVYAIPGATGAAVVQKLADYSNMETAPGGTEILHRYSNYPATSFRMFATVGTDQVSTSPSLWLFLLIVVAVLAGNLLLTSAFMHWRARRRRDRLRRMIVNGEVALSDLGTKKLTVPQDDIDKMPLYVYVTNSQPSDSERSEAQPISPAAVVSVTEPEEEDAILQKPTAIITVTATEIPTPESAEDTVQVVSNPLNNPILPKIFESEAQPSCPICLDDYVSNKTIVRSLPCHHIFHPECIDKFLSRNSSMCPMCKQSALPAGYCPPFITSAMVSRERDMRMRAQLELLERTPGAWFRNVRLWWLRRRARRNGRRLEQNSLELALRRAMVRESVQRSNARRQNMAQMTRSQRAEVRGRELAGDNEVVGEHVEERPRTGWRRALERMFP